MNGITTLMLLITLRSSLEKQPNVLFIIVDDLKPALHSYGYKNAYTPNIDALAKKSFLFNNTFSQQALCAPSRNSLLTSRRPDSLHLYDFYNYWRTTIGNFTTLPQYFKENGYFTYSIGKVFHPGVSSNFTDDYPYSWSRKPFHPKTEIYENAKVCVGENGNLEQNLLCPVIVEAQPDETLPDLEILNESLYFLRNKKETTSQPYFLAVGFHKPHIPFRIPLQYLDYHPLQNVTLPSNRWRPSLLPDVAWNPWTDIRKRDDIKKLHVPFPYGPFPDQTVRQIIQYYNAATSYIDDLIGKLLSEVDENTIIIFTSDHGWSLGQHGEFAKYSNFEEATRVPLLIHVPRLSKRRIIIEDLVELVDIFPTVVDLTQVAKSLPVCEKQHISLVCTEGSSLVSVMVDKLQSRVSTRIKKMAVFSQYPRPGVHPSVQPNSDKPHLRDIKIMGYSVTTRRYRYTEWVKFFPTNFTVDWNVSYGKELYNHLIDPDENINLADRDEMRTVIELLRQILIQGWRKTNRAIRSPAPLLVPSRRGSSFVENDRLKSGPTTDRDRSFQFRSFNPNSIPSSQSTTLAWFAHQSFRIEMTEMNERLKRFDRFINRSPIDSIVAKRTIYTSLERSATSSDPLSSPLPAVCVAVPLRAKSDTLGVFRFSPWLRLAVPYTSVTHWFLKFRLLTNGTWFLKIPVTKGTDMRMPVNA
ncbi:hypothetical protein NQ315_004695, partial [Exocentrus adspersus]